MNSCDSISSSFCHAHIPKYIDIRHTFILGIDDNVKCVLIVLFLLVFFYSILRLFCKLYQIRNENAMNKQLENQRIVDLQNRRTYQKAEDIDRRKHELKLKYFEKIKDIDSDKFEKHVSKIFD